MRNPQRKRNIGWHIVLAQFGTGNMFWMLKICFNLEASPNHAFSIGFSLSASSSSASSSSCSHH